MSIETNIATVRRFRDGLNAGNFDEADTVLADNLVVHMGSDPNPLNFQRFLGFRLDHRRYRCGRGQGR